MANLAKSPRVLFYDIETAPLLSWTWGVHDIDSVIAVSKSWYMLTFAWTWNDEPKIHSLSLPQFKNYHKDKSNDKDLCQALWNLFDEADIVIGHNSDRFDNRKSNARFIQHGFKPPAPYQTVDTLKLARKSFMFESNKLNDLGQYLGVGKKLVHTGFDLWLGCFLRDEKKSWRMMREYNENDVALLRRVYHKLKPWQTNAPNMNLYLDTTHNCPICGSYKIARAGHRMTRAGKTQRYQCGSCGGWSTAPKSKTAVVR